MTTLLAHPDRIGAVSGKGPHGSLPWPELLPRCHPAADSRRIAEGRPIPAGYYADQPYVIRADDGAWVCVVTTGAEHEGQRGQHVVTLRSRDEGRSWQDRVEIEPPSGPEASWGVLLKAPGGRLFVFYVFNADNLRELPADDPPWEGGKTTRMDSHGHYVFRWSDDHGKTWSRERATIPVREFAIDRENSTGGRVRLFWNVGRPLIRKGEVLLTLHKVKGFGAGWFTASEGALVASNDLLEAANPADATWVTLPDGDTGIRAPQGGGPVAEEHNLLLLSDGSLAVIYRTLAGHPAQAYSRDGGHTWSEPDYLRHSGGRPLKHPRAACFAWRLSDGGYVLWYHHHGGRFIREHPQRADASYADRNPVWMCRGREEETPEGLRLVWDNPEITLYDDDPCVRMSYPDLIEQEGKIFLTETQKMSARVHEMSDPLATALRAGPAAFSAAAIQAEAVLDWPACGPVAALPPLPYFLGWDVESPYGHVDLRAGFSIEFALETTGLDGDVLLLSACHAAFGGIVLRWQSEGVLVFQASDGRTEWTCRTDAGILSGEGPHHLVLVVDGGPKIASFVVNGTLCDGGSERQFGWSRFSPHFRGILWRGPLEFSSEGVEAMPFLRIYDRAILSAEAESLFREFDVFGHSEGLAPSLLR
ncbi:MAG: exo-alpha-sialidase [Chthoniobacterales bacterium]|nr:exo-alpha-sialidase [Chthoniobacterales bacterium]